MKKLQCEVCGCSDIQKVDSEVFACAGCGIQYRTEDLKALLTDVPDAPQAAPPAAPQPVYSPAPPPIPTVPYAPPPITEQTYTDTLRNCGIFLIIGLVLLTAGLVARLLFSGWIGAILCLAAELVLLAPNEKVKNLCKKQFALLPDKHARKVKTNATIIALKAANPFYKISFILAYISLAGLIFCLI